MFRSSLLRSLALAAFLVAGVAARAQTPTPSPSASPSPSPTLSPSPTRSPTASPSPSPTPRAPNATEEEVLETRVLYSQRLSLWDANYRRIATLTAPLNMPSVGVTVELPRVSGRILPSVRTRQATGFTNGSDGAWAAGYPSGLNALGWDSFPGPTCTAGVTDGLVGFALPVDVGDTITGYRILGSIYYASGSGESTFGASLRRGNVDAARIGGLHVEDLDSIATVTTTETVTFDEAVTLGTPETVEVGRTYWIEGVATTDAGAYVLVTGVYVMLE